MHTAQDADLARAGIDGHPEPLRVEGDRARGPAEVTVGGERHTDRPGGLVQLLQREPATRVDHRLLREPAVVARYPQVGGGEVEEHVREGTRGAQGGLARDHHTGGGEGAGVVLDDVRVGLADGDPVDGRGEFAGRDLPVHRGGAVAELRRTDSQVEAAVGQQRGAGIGDVATRRSRRDHRERGALADEPAVRDGLRGGLGLGETDDADALVQAVAGYVQVLLPTIGGDHRFPGADDVLGLELQWVQAEVAGEFIRCGLDGEHDLAESVAAEGAGRDGVGVDGVGVDLLARGAVDRHRLADAVEHHRRSVIAVRARVGDDP